MTQNTPTPWLQDATHVYDQRENCVANCDQKNYGRDEANAAFIVRAVNSHDALVKALEKSAEGWSNAIELGIIPTSHIASATFIRDAARTALALAKGE